MLMSVSLYAMFGALVFRKIESSMVYVGKNETNTRWIRSAEYATTQSYKSEALSVRTQPWTLAESVLFSFTIITTIGYGNVAPQTNFGRTFCIVYGLIGIPFTLLAIADLGKFITELVEVSSYALSTLTRCFFVAFCLIQLKASLSVNSVINTQHKSDAISLLILFTAYIVFGAGILSLYEPDMTFFKVMLFYFVLRSVVLNIISKFSEAYMAFTIIYITVGLALTTNAIEIAADTLKKLHYYGRKIENVANVSIWFGGKKLTVRQLIRNLGDHFNLPVTAVVNLNIDEFVDKAIKVEAGEIPSLQLCKWKNTYRISLYGFRICFKLSNL
uniref:Ion_trans_2 domain-containing protein n=1 Tax=Syphacia muris TaxID=451379 RepID=A0A0N5ADN3_9BILA